MSHRGKPRRIALRVVVAFVVEFGTLAAFVWAIVPDVAPLAVDDPTTTAYIEAAPPALGARSPLAWTPLADIAPVAVCAVVMAEDRFFARHRGFDRRQILRAIGLHLGGGHRMGASTITQQLARNLFLARDPTLTRKVHEALIARALEENLDKSRILELYLNVIEWGPGVWGVTAASRHYLDKAPSALTLPEAVFLTSLVAAPRAAWSGSNLERMSRLQSRVIGQLHESALAPRREANAAWRVVSRIDASIVAGAPLRSALAAPPLASTSGDSALAARRIAGARSGDCASDLQTEMMIECERDPRALSRCPDPERDAWR